MVKVINPFFSISCHGRFSGCVYQTSRYGQIVRTHIPQRYKPTTAQLQQNLYFGNAVDSWRLLSAEEKQEYNNRACGKHMSGFNLYIKENIQHP